MAYTRTLWVDGTAPAVDASHLNNIEVGIEDLDARVLADATDISLINTTLGTQTTNIATNVVDITALETTLTNTVIIRQGIFSGTWAPTLSSTMGIANFADYNWVVTVWKTTFTILNNTVVIGDGYLDVDGVTLRFSSSVDGVGTEARYTLVGTKKTISLSTTVNQ